MFNQPISEVSLHVGRLKKWSCYELSARDFFKPVSQTKVFFYAKHQNKALLIVGIADASKDVGYFDFR